MSSIGFIFFNTSTAFSSKPQISASKENVNSFKEPSTVKMKYRFIDIKT